MAKREKSAELIGQMVDNKYHLESLIGEGGFGAVFRAREQASGNLYAIKILSLDEQMSDAQLLKQIRFFQREVGTLARVHHPGIVAVIEGGLTREGLPYLVMELAEGNLLSKILRREGGLSLARMAHIFSQLCAAVAAIHERGIIHRDLKPDNIVIQNPGENETIKLLDFGLAKLVRGDNEEQWMRTLTGRGQVHGTLYYMSPEQTQGQKLDERTDIYSLGVIAYELLAGRPPFRAKSPIGLMMQHLESLPPPLRSVRPDLPVAVEIALLKALDKDRARRYGNALEFSQQIEAATAGCATAHLKPSEQPLSSSGTTRTEVIPLDEQRLTEEMTLNERVELKKEREPEEKPPGLTRIWEIFNKLKGK